MAWGEYSAPPGSGTNLQLNIMFAGGNAISGAMSNTGMDYVSDAQYQAVVDLLCASPLVANVVITDYEAVTRVMTKTPPGDDES